MNFRTRVHIPEMDFHIDHNKKIMLFGSCFSENIGQKLIQYKFNADINPFGILYNPLSISTAIRKLIIGDPITESDLVKNNDMYHSFMHHGSFSDINKKNCLHNISERFVRASVNIKSTDILLITFGTSNAFRFNEDGKIVSNCHKFPANQFIRFRLTVDEIVDDWSDLIHILTSLNPEIKIVFTVSPIRHWKDGAHENQISKSILHMSIDRLLNLSNKRCCYFPSYEIMIDDLRDYRFYDEDMMHPSQVALDYIWERFSEAFFTDYTKSINNEWLQISKSIHHRPIYPNSVAFKKFIANTTDRLKDFAAKYPYISCKEELSIMNQLVNKFS